MPCAPPPPPLEILLSYPNHSIRCSVDLSILISCPFSSVTPELPSIPSEYSQLVIHTVLEPVLQGLQGLPPPVQAPVLGEVLTAILGAWLDHILTHRIRFRWGETKVVAEWMNGTGKGEGMGVAE